VAEEAYLFNSPLVAFEGAADAAPLMTLSSSGLIVDCIKPAEDGNGYIVRAYEPYGLPGKVEVQLNKCATVTEESPLEKKLADVTVGDRFTVAYKPFEFRTFRIV
jgi:alpha-mannosidase